MKAPEENKLKVITKDDCEKILERLRKKANQTYSERCRMPSVKDICKILTAYNIEYKFDTTTNIVEYRSGGNRYVNSRHNGKEGFSLEIYEINLHLDTSDSYYSWNSWSYAKDIVKLIEEKQKQS